MSSALDQRVHRERISHTEKDVLAENIRIKNKFPHLAIYPSKIRLLEKFGVFTGNVNGKTVLDHGCGRGSASLEYLKNKAAFVYGIDISPVYIEECIQAANELGYESNSNFSVMDAHRLEFKDNTFDLIAGNGILHHLDMDIALAEIHRTLKPDGMAFFIEPLADNPLLFLFRLLTPHARTVDERPLTGKQLENLCRHEKWDVDILYCGLCNAVVSMITSILLPSTPDNFFIRLSDNLETWLIEHKILLSWNQYVLIKMTKEV